MSETQSVYQLVSKLCSCLIKESDENVENLDLNRLKSVAFKALLTADCEKSIIDREKLLEEIDFVTFELRLVKKVRESSEIVEFSKNLYDGIESIYWLLLSLRNIDPDEDSSRLKNGKHFFKLTTNFNQTTQKNAYFSPHKSSEKFIQLQTSSSTAATPIDDHNFFSDIIESATGMKKIKSYQFPQSKSPLPVKKTESISSTISSTKFHFNWENLDYESIAEKSFSSESSEAFSHLSVIKEQKQSKEIKIVSFEKLLNDLRLLTIGVESETFKRTAEDLTFEMVLDVACGDILCLNPFVDEFLEAGSCFRRLKTFTSKKPFNQNYFLEGFILKAYCDCLVRFMNSYRDIVYSQHVDTLLEFSQNTRCIRTILIHITKFLNIHPSYRHIRTKLPTGSDFLNFLYNEYMTIVCESTKFFFVESLKACCQIYFTNFQKWVFHATLDGRYKELFIYFNNQYRPNTKYFFDRAYLIRKSSVPSFLHGCSDEILLCGKYTMLLRSFNQVHPLFSIPKPEIRVCMTDVEISELMIECKNFVQNARDVCGRRISIEEILNERHKRNAEKYKRAEEASVKNFQRWQLEQEDLQRAINERRELQMQDLQREWRRIEEKKLLKRMEEIQQEKNYLDEMKSVEEYEMKKENEEIKKRVKIYQELNENLDKDLKHKAQLINDLKDKAKCSSEVCSMELYSQVPTNLNKDDEVNANLPEEIKISVTSEVRDVESNEHQQENSTENLQYENSRSQFKNMDTKMSTVVEATDEMNNLVKIQKSTMTEAQRNKMKVMSHEYNNFSSFNFTDDQNGNMSTSEAAKNLTEAQKNKFKVMSHEFGMIGIENEKHPIISVEQSENLTDLQKNRLKVMSSEYFLEQDIPKMPEKNLDLKASSISPRTSQILESPVSDLMAMSVTSDHFSTNESKESEKSNEQVGGVDAFENHDDVDDNDDELLFKAFEAAVEKNSSHFLGADLSNVSSGYDRIKTTNTLEMSQYLQMSLMIPVNSYMKMLNNETLKMFVENLNIISHFKSLRNYFLMMNGEFSISVCHQLFTKLERGIKPLELLNYQSLHMILDHALSKSRHDENTEQLSFIVKTVPEKFEIYSPAVLTVLTLSYKLEWPLNLTLNPETMEQYQAIFNYLLKLKRISWVLDECFQLLKSALRLHGKDLLISQQYRNVQQIRHKMTHFVHCLENYVTRNVLQISWIGFMEDLKKAESVHCVYKKHTSFLKRILFLCLLNKKSVEFQKQIEGLFKVILRFYKHLKNTDWSVTAEGFSHPKYTKFESVDQDFERMIKYIMYLGNKVIQHGYQKEIYDLLHLIDINGYYSND